MSYAQAVSVKKIGLFNPTKTIRGIYDKAEALLPLQEYLSRLKRIKGCRPNGNSLEGRFEHTPFTTYVIPLSNKGSRNGVGYIRAELHSNNSKQRKEMGKLLRKYETPFA